MFLTKLAIILILPVAFLAGILIAFRMLRRQLGEELARKTMKERAPIFIVTGAGMALGTIIALFWRGGLGQISLTCVGVSLVVFSGMCVIFIWRSARGGKLLYTAHTNLRLLKPLPWFYAIPVLASLIILLATWGNSTAQQRFIYYGVGTSSLVMLILVHFMRRVELRLKGILMMGAWIPWEQIRSYSWGALNANALMLDRRKSSWWLKMYPIVLLPEEKDAVEKILVAQVNADTGSSVGQEQFVSQPMQV